MLINCKSGCKLSQGTTTASLDLDSDEVWCNQCYQVIPNVSSFAKTAMRNSGDIYRRAKAKPVLFACMACSAKVEVDFNDDALKGKGCEGNCSFNIPKPMVVAMKIVAKNKQEEEEIDE